MCSCKSKSIGAAVKVIENNSGEVSVMTSTAKVDTVRAVHTEQLSDIIVIKESLIIKEYDKDTGTLTKETYAEREATQDSKAHVEEEKSGKVIELRADSLGKVENVDIGAELVGDSVTGSASNSFFSGFGKGIGMVAGCAIGLLIVYLLKQKNRIN